jgi:hypothetical protein
VSQCPIGGWRNRQGTRTFRNVATWADTASPTTAPVTASPDDAIALYKLYIATGLQERFTVKNTDGGEEITIFCRFPNLPAASTVYTRSHPTQRRPR